MIFVDTSGFFALADRADRRHIETRSSLEKAVRDRETLWTHNYVVLESLALFTRRLSPQIACVFLSDIERFHVEWVTHPIHKEALRVFLAAQGKGPSLVDCSSFILMRKTGTTAYLGHDRHFEEAGFNPFGMH